MANDFNNSVTKLRRFLRDPDGNIWSTADLLSYWNDALLEISQKTHILEKVITMRWPPDASWVVTYDWEKEELDGDIINLGELYQQTPATITWPWEAAYYLDGSDLTGSGYTITYPWEAYYVNPGHIVWMPLHGQTYRIKMMAFDEDVLEPRTQSEIARNDPYYRSHSGTPQYYWQKDEYSNQIVLYPRPTCTNLEEIDETDLVDDEGGVIEDYGWLDYTDIGVKIDLISSTLALMCVYEPYPAEAETDSENEFPEWMVKYVEYATLERAYGADTDGFIPSLRDYWAYRKEIGLQAIKRYKTARLKDRVFCMKPLRRPVKATPKLPYGYNDPY